LLRVMEKILVTGGMDRSLLVSLGSQSTAAASRQGIALEGSGTSLVPSGVKCDHGIGVGGGARGTVNLLER